MLPVSCWLSLATCNCFTFVWYDNDLKIQIQRQRESPYLYLKSCSFWHAWFTSMSNMVTLILPDVILFYCNRLTQRWNTLLDPEGVVFIVLRQPKVWVQLCMCHVTSSLLQPQPLFSYTTPRRRRLQPVAHPLHKTLRPQLPSSILPQALNLFFLSVFGTHRCAFFSDLITAVEVTGF